MTEETDIRIWCTTHDCEWSLVHYFTYSADDKRCVALPREIPEATSSGIYGHAAARAFGELGEALKSEFSDE